MFLPIGEGNFIKLEEVNQVCISKDDEVRVYLKGSDISNIVSCEYVKDILTAFNIKNNRKGIENENKWIKKDCWR